MTGRGLTRMLEAMRLLLTHRQISWKIVFNKAFTPIRCSPLIAAWDDSYEVNMKRCDRLERQTDFSKIKPHSLFCFLQLSYTNLTWLTDWLTASTTNDIGCTEVLNQCTRLEMKFSQLFSYRRWNVFCYYLYYFQQIAWMVVVRENILQKQQKNIQTD